MNAEQKKVVCTLCGLKYFKHTITVHEDKPYCPICEVDYLTENMQKSSAIRMPGFFINQQHYKNYLDLLINTYAPIKQDPNFVLAAYINGIPALYNIYPKEEQVFRDVPFMWQFNWRVFHINIEENIQSRVYVDKFPEQNNFILSLNDDCKLLIGLGHMLNSSIEPFHVESLLTFEKYRLSVFPTLSYSGKEMMNQIFNFYLCEGESV
jgi:hypothetical protein